MISHDILDSMRSWIDYDDDAFVAAPPVFLEENLSCANESTPSDVVDNEPSNDPIKYDYPTKDFIGYVRDGKCRKKPEQTRAVLVWKSHKSHNTTTYHCNFISVDYNVFEQVRFSLIV